MQIQRETHINNDVKIKLELKNKNLEEDIRSSTKQYEKYKEEYEFQIKRLKADYEELSIKNVEN